MASAGGPLDIDRLMREIRADVASRFPAPGDEARFDAGVGGVAPGARFDAPRLGRHGEFDEPLPAKSAYRVGDFLAYHDEDFIRTAYRALLGREPDAEGASRYLARIRSGDLARIEVLGRIRYSAEGKAARMRVDGLAVPFALRTARRIPVVGRLLGIVQYLWRLPDLARNHEMLESAVFANRHAMRARINASLAEIEQALGDARAASAQSLLEVVSRIDADAGRLAVRVDGLARSKAEQSALADLRLALAASAQALEAKVATAATAAGEAIERLRASVTEAAAKNAHDIAALRDADQDLEQRLAQLVPTAAKNARDIAALRDADQDLAQRLAQLVPAADFAMLVASAERASGDLRRIALALDETRAWPPERVLLPHERELAALVEAARRGQRTMRDMAAPDAAPESAAEVAEGFYVAFEDRFRGTRDDIKQRVEVFLPAVRAAGAGTAEAPVLDIGSGRGEWLELLEEQGLVATGIDSNRVAAAGCRARGLDVVEADGIDYLRSRAADSAGAISAIHVIEHLPFARLVELFDEAHRVLRPGGVVIFETPNPENLIVGACDFYTDPTHVRPLPPEPYRFILESRGFARVEIMRLHPNPLAAAAGEATGEFGKAITERLFGPRDYALIGFKG